ncbi:carbohydrate kinase family protein [Rhodovibrio salinarum]|uniref:Carbohydrate kinase n=1 Tax=Rhodovibrio salinarum TaxID=1087 RepID=A0A934QHR8_9PROT|nr:carbohydrate kinase [Rhodovibrio salinarum]MBK1697206.1 carbohydrate kinase [Rhodovibrio salinarum]
MFVVCGEALWDLFGGETSSGDLQFDARVGGSPFNVAVGVARLGKRSALLTGLSADSLGRRLHAALDREGVDTALLMTKQAPTTLSLVDLGPDGHPAYAFYGTGAADRALAAEDLPQLGEDVSGLHFGSYSLVTDSTGSSLLELAHREAGRRLITLDPNVRPTVEPDLALWRQRIAAFVKTADLVKVSVEDLETLYPGVAPAEIARCWLSTGAKLVVVTAGGQGAEAFTAAEHVRMPARRVDVVDAVGAGDTFQAALIAALLESGRLTGQAVAALDAEALSRLLDFAMAAAALTCARRGADLAYRAELPALDLEVH